MNTASYMLSSTRANIAVRLFGDDLATLRRLGEHVRDAMSGVQGVVDLSLEQQMDVPFVRFVLARQGSRPRMSRRPSKPASPVQRSAASLIGVRLSIWS
jgi:hypothetical protein